MHPGQSYSRGNGWRGRQDNGFQRGGRGRYGRGANFHSNPNTMDEPHSYPQSPTQRTDKNDVASWGKKELSALVKGFVDSTDTNELKFPPTLSPAQRQLVHQIAMRFSLDHKSHGVGLERALVLTKPMGTLQQRICDGVTSGQRVKTIDGYQGAQALPDDFLDVVTAGKVIEQLQVHQAKMYRDIRIEANRPLRKAKRLHVIEPGLQCPPKSTISVERYHELQHFRKSLPSYRQRDTIVNTVVNNDVVVVCGDTGCGKTTQIPQMLYDAGIFPQNSTVICTQPRRISALSVATRVAEERGEACGDSSGYIIRFENTTSSNTHILYATTGILLRRLHTEPELHGVSCVIVDEVHERDVETDFCLLLLRDRLAAQQRYSERFPVKLKVVVMSATVQIDALVNYFDGYNGNRPVPLVRIPGTLFPVEEYFLEDAINWVRADPKSVPTMSLLSVQQAPVAKQMPEAASGGHFENIKNTVFGSVDRDVESLIPYNLVCDLIVHMHNSRRNVLSESILVFLPGWQPINRVADLLRRSQVSSELSILMLHSSLTSAEQSRVFVPPPKRYRKVVLATSIAETSITIDDIVFVIDCGFSKGTSYDCTDNTASLRASLISKANGIQRKGRAGRCRAGICVHLLPKAVYENLAEFLPPEIVRSSLDEVCLQVKAIQPNEKCTTVLARAMSPPPEASVSHAVEFLTEIGAFTEEDECLTNLGRALSRLPVHPLLGKMLFSAACFGVLGTISTIAAGLSVKSPFIKPLKFQQPAARESRLRLDGNDLSDHLCIVKLYNEWIRCGRSFQYANDNFADPSSLKQVDRTKKQLMRLVLQSPLVAKMKNAVVNACRHDSNTGLSRLVMLWSLYPRIATVEYRANRSSNIPNVYCWDNKPAQISIGSALATRKKADIGSRSFIVYYERMQLECQLNLFDSSCISPVDVCLCLRQLTVLPLQQVPKLLLDDFESAQAPPKRLDLSSLPTELYSAMLFDGDKKFYVAPHCVARALQMARDCMDYYLALSIKELRADLFPESLISAIALAIGYPIRDEVTTSYSNVQGRAQPTDVFSAENRHAPLYTRQSSDSEDDGEDGPLICEDDDPEVLQLSACDKEKVIAAFGNLAVFRCDGANELLSAARVGEAQLKDEKDVAQANSDTAPRDIDNSPNEIDDDDDDDDGVILVPAGAL